MEEGEEAGLRGWGAVLKKLSVLFSMDTMFWPLGLHHNNTYGFKFLPPPSPLNSIAASLSCIIRPPLKDMNFPSIETPL